MKKIFIPFLILAFLIAITDDANAQRRGKKQREKKEDTQESNSSDSRDEEEFEGPGFGDKLNIEIKPGNLNFFGNQLSLYFKSNVGYKFNNTFSAGVGGKLYYDYINGFGNNDLSVFSFGGLVYGRAKISSAFYAQVEYNAVNFGSISTTPAVTLTYPTAGIGYMQEGYSWSYGIELLAVLNDEVRDRQGSIVEYWINFSHNF